MNISTGLFQNRRRRGAMLVLFAICLPIFIIMMVFSIDVAYMQLTKTELRTATDAAARAGSRTLSLEQDRAAAIAASKDAASRNIVANDTLQLADADVILGASTQPDPTGRFVFQPNAPVPNAVRINGQRTQGSLSGPVNLFVGRLLGTDLFEPVATTVSTQIDRDIALVIDRSGSMTFAENSNRFPPGFIPCTRPPNTARWFDVVTATQAFIDELNQTPQEELLSLSTYNQTASLDTQLDGNYAAVTNRINDLTNNFCGGATGIGNGMIEGLRTLANTNRSREFASKVLVVLTDGNHNSGIGPEAIAQQAADQDVTVFTITFSNQADQTRMRRAAEIGNGQHFHAPTGEALIDVFREVAKTAANLITE